MNPTSIFSVDVEDYFHVESFASVVKREDWGTYACRVEANTRRLLDVLDRHGVKGTFFILGWVAERYPALVREIVTRGHEPACHSYWHRLVYQLTPEQFHEDTRRAKEVVEQAAGEAVYGYRAPSFSIVERSIWAWEVLASLGFTYDSSIFSIHHDVYGYPQAPRRPFAVHTKAGDLVEYPMTTFRVGSQNLPVGGGGYLRIFPFWYTRAGVGMARKQQVPVISYIHPWELDPEQPRLEGRLTSRLRHYTNLGRTERLLGKLFGLGEFGPFRSSGLERFAREQIFTPNGAGNGTKRHDAGGG